MMDGSTPKMGCNQSQSSTDTKGSYACVPQNGLAKPDALGTCRRLDSQTLTSWTHTGSDVWGFCADVDYVGRNYRLQPWANCGRHFEVLLPAPINTEELDVKYTYEEIQIEETGSWKNYRIKLKSSYKHLMLSKYKHSPCLEAAQVIGCRQHIIVLQLVLQDKCQFLVVDTLQEITTKTFELQNNNNNPYLYDCYISPDFSTYVLKPNALFILKYKIIDIEDALIVFSSIRGVCQNDSDYLPKEHVKRILSSNVVVQDSNEVHTDNRQTEDNGLSKETDDNGLPKQPNAGNVLQQSAILFKGQSRELVMTFDPRFKHSRLVVGIQHSTGEHTLNQYCLTSGKTITQASCGDVQGLQSLTFSPCGKVIAVSITNHIPDSGAFPRKFNFTGVQLHDAADLQLLQKIPATGTSALTSLTPAAIFPLFSTNGQYIALAGGSGTEVNRVEVYAVPTVINLQHQCRLVLRQWLTSHDVMADILPTNDTLKDIINFKPSMD